jgi:hypothetical protein
MYGTNITQGSYAVSIKSIKYLAASTVYIATSNLKKFLRTYDSYSCLCFIRVIIAGETSVLVNWKEYIFIM